ncbi:DUF4326 domain-containing protein (plasmid) [Streptomyces sp. LZ34]
MPARVQRTRKKGQPGMPPGARYVGRGPGRAGRYGNPWHIVRDGLGIHVMDPDGHLWADAQSMTEARAIATAEYDRWVHEPEQAELRATARAELRGRDLACWCSLPEHGEPDHCHAQVLLRLANAPKEN